ncbi:MAK10-like protein [Tanacetum coccineum]
MGDANPIGTLGDYSKPSREGYRNTIKLPIGNNVVPLRSDTIRLVQNGCSFHGLRSEDPNQHLKDFLKLVDSLDLDVGSITTWEDLTTRFLAQFFPPGRTAKLRNDILINAKESWALLEDLALYENESWNDPRDFAKPVKAISLPQDVPSTSDRRLIELENQVQRLMEAHLAPMQPTQVNKITTSCEICSGPHDTQYCMEDPEQAFVDYASSRTDKAGVARLSKFEADFKQQKSEMTNKIDTVLKAITYRMAGALPCDTISNAHHTPPLQSMLSKHVLRRQTFPRQVSCNPGWGAECNNQKNLNQLLKMNSRICILTYRIMCKHNPLYLFKKFNIRLLEETDHIFGLADGTKSYPVGIVKDIEFRIRKLKLLNDFYIIDMKKDPEIPLLVGRGFLATANAVINYRKAKIAESEDLIDNLINWDKLPKDGDGAWHAKIRIINSDGEEFTETIQSIPTTRKLSERESPREIINLGHFYDT